MSKATLFTVGAICIAFLAVLSSYLFADEAPPPPPRVVAQPPGQPREASPWQTTPPVLSLPGPFGEDNPVNLVEHGLTQWLGGAFSFMVTLQMDDLNEWSRIFDFSLAPDWETIGAGNVEYGFDLFFSSYQGSSSSAVNIPDFFVLGREVTVLFTISANGEMKVYQDGELFAENPDGQPPSYVERPHLTVGNHHLYKSQGFRGTLKDIKVWTQEVSWPEAPPPPKPKAKPAEKPAGTGKPAAKQPEGKGKPKPAGKGKPEGKPAAKGKPAAGKGRG